MAAARKIARPRFPEKNYFARLWGAGAPQPSQAHTPMWLSQRGPFSLSSVNPILPYALIENSWPTVLKFVTVHEFYHFLKLVKIRFCTSLLRKFQVCIFCLNFGLHILCTNRPVLALLALQCCFSSIINCICTFAYKISILSVIFRDSEFYFSEFISIFKIRKNSWILRIFKIHKIRILNLRPCGSSYDQHGRTGVPVNSAQTSIETSLENTWSTLIASGNSPVERKHRRRSAAATASAQNHREPLLTSALDVSLSFSQTHSSYISCRLSLLPLLSRTLPSTEVTQLTLYKFVCYY